MKSLRVIMASVIIFFLLIATDLSAIERLAISPDGAIYQPIYNSATKITTIMRIDHANQMSPFYSLSEPTNCHIINSSLNSNGDKIALFCFCRFPHSDSTVNYSTGFYRIVVIDLKTKKQILSFDHGRSISFSPSGDEIAIAVNFPEAHDGERTPPGFEEAYGLWIYNFKTKENKRIDTGYVGVMRLVWSDHDGNIYVSNNQDIFRYDVAKGKGEVVEALRGIDFSPDGRYYVGLSSSNRLIYQSSDNQPVSKWNDKLPEMGKYAGFLAWLDGGSKVLVYSGNYDYCVFDLETSTVVKNIKGHVLGRNANGTKLLIHPAIALPNKKFDINREVFEVVDIEKPSE